MRDVPLNENAAKLTSRNINIHEEQNVKKTMNVRTIRIVLMKSSVSTRSLQLAGGLKQLERQPLKVPMNRLQQTHNSL